MQGCGNAILYLSDWSHFIQDKCKKKYLSWDKYKENKCNSVFYILISYFELTMSCCMEYSVDPDQLASEEASLSGFTLFSVESLYLVSYCF